MKRNRTKTGSRDPSLDLIKTIAILSVLTIHAFTSCFRSKMGSPDWYSGMFLSAAARAGVPLFLMVTGALMLRPDKELTLKRLYTRYLPRLLIALFFWAFLYHVYDLWETGTMNAANLWFRFKRLFFFDHEQHLYYLHIILLFYAMLPVLRVFTKHADRRTLRYALALWFVTGILLPVVFRRLDRFPKVLLAGAGLSLCIELLQLPFSVRASDVDDLILNTLGVIVGYGIYALFRRRKRHGKKDRRAL